MGYLHHNSGYIQKFSVKLIDEQNGVKSARLTIETDNGTKAFRITADINQPDLSNIISDLQAGMEAAMSPSGSIQINEYKERFYIFVTYSNEKLVKYTGTRIS